jgi:hypothetical protein
MDCRAYSDIANRPWSILWPCSSRLCVLRISLCELCARASELVPPPKYLLFLRGGDAISVRRVEFRLITSQGAAGLECVAGRRGGEKGEKARVPRVTRLRKARKKDLDTQPSLQATESRQTLRELRGFRADSEQLSISLVTRCKSSFFGRSRGISSTVSFEYTQRKSRHHHNILSHINSDQPPS